MTYSIKYMDGLLIIHPLNGSSQICGNLLLEVYILASSRVNCLIKRVPFRDVVAPKNGAGTGIWYTRHHTLMVSGDNARYAIKPHFSSAAVSCSLRRWRAHQGARQDVNQVLITRVLSCSMGAFIGWSHNMTLAWPGSERSFGFRFLF